MKYWITVILLCAAGAASAHPGHADAGLTSGLMHPLAGVDHWLAMLGLGLWSRAAKLQAKVILTAGAALCFGAFVQPGLPAVESLLAASVLVAALMAAGATRLPAWLGLALAAGFCVVHGQAHGQELLGAAAAAGAIASSLLLLAGGWLAASSTQVLRTAPAMLAVAGTALFAMA